MYRTFVSKPGQWSNPEFQSAAVRMGIWIFGLFYIGLGAATGYYQVDVRHFVALFAGFLVVGVGLFVSVLRQPHSPVRRYLSLLIDILATSLVILLTQEAISPFYLFYIWIFISAGTRYGRSHLIFATLASVVAYGLVLVALDHWLKHPFEAAFFLLLLVALPLYQYSLLARVQQARAEAERANRAKSDFLAVMTHELRTPLTGVIGMTDLLKATELTKEQQEYVQGISRSAELLRSLIGDILDLSKIDARRLELEAIPFDLRTTLEEVCRLIEPRALDKGLTLSLRIAPGLSSSYVGDPLRIRQILLNLLGNAVKFTERGEVELSVEHRPPEDAVTEPHLLIQVRDTGIGMSTEQLAIVFERFRQADQSTTRRFGGSGLGTTIARDLTRLMGGTIGAESTPGQGSRFWIRLPLPSAGHPVPATPEPSPVSSSGAPASADQRPAGIRVLVAEDNEIAAKVIVTFLERLGHRVVRVADGEEALQRIAAGAFDIAFIDLRMPKLDGLALTCAVRARERGRRLPIVALTADAAEDTRAACLAAGMDDFLSKPIKAEALREMIERLAPHPAAPGMSAVRTP
ncbi:ATP-binding protein [Thioalkalicoccus limnaeus]|uniref:histidine kinase n=1 Tax=Thioalkalicoccus limnaeus TaxID=120681 RepID=A0ABV4BGW7_9GAMM